MKKGKIVSLIKYIWSIYDQLGSFHHIGIAADTISSLQK